VGRGDSARGDEVKRIQKQYGPTRCLCRATDMGDPHDPRTHGCQTHLLEMMGGYTLQARNADSWEGWYWGAKHVWGQDP